MQANAFVNVANPQTQEDPLYSVIDSQDIARYTEPPRGNHVIQTDRAAAATAYEIPVRALPKAGPRQQQEGGGVIIAI